MVSAEVFDTPCDFRGISFLNLTVVSKAITNRERGNRALVIVF